MKITVLGATGHVGQELVTQALAAGHTVTVLVRSPEKLGDLRSRITVVQGDVANVSDVERAVASSDAVLNTLGHARGSANDVLTVASTNVIKAMKVDGTRRLVVLTNTAVSDPDDQPTAGQKFQGALMKLVIGQINRDHVSQAQIIADSGLDWTIVRAVTLSDGEHTSKYKVGKLDTSAGSHIANADVADFMLQCLASDKYVRSRPVISL